MAAELWLSSQTCSTLCIQNFYVMIETLGILFGAVWYDKNGSIPMLSHTSLPYKKYISRAVTVQLHSRFRNEKLLSFASKFSGIEVDCSCSSSSKRTFSLSIMNITIEPSSSNFSSQCVCLELLMFHYPDSHISVLSKKVCRQNIQILSEDEQKVVVCHA